jgi:hypothetical protein
MAISAAGLGSMAWALATAGNRERQNRNDFMI